MYTVQIKQLNAASKDLFILVNNFVFNNDGGTTKLPINYTVHNYHNVGTIFSYKYC